MVAAQTSSDDSGRSSHSAAGRATLRPSFAERDSFRSALTQAYGDGRIDDEEFDRRSTLIETGTQAADLRRALAGLPQPEVEFPATVTRAQALECRRRPRASGSVRLGRRALLIGGAAALGFVLAGGFDGTTGSQGARSGPGKQPDRDLLYDFEALQEVLERVREKGYTHFTRVSIDPGTFDAEARSVRSENGVDYLKVYGDGELEITAGRHLSEHEDLFTLENFALDLLPAMARAAREELGGTNGERAQLSVESGAIDSRKEPMITVLVHGGDYGEGGGHLRWTGDGKELDSIHRADEG